MPKSSANSKSGCIAGLRTGSTGFLFDNADDTLTFSNFQTFNFGGWGDAPDVLEPLLFYVLHRASLQIADPARLGTFKLFLLDEAWLFIKNETIRSYIVSAQKTWRKHNAAMILATQSIKELEESGMLQIVAESCPTKIFLANPEMNREVYREAFHLNDTELGIISDLTRGQMLIRKAQTSKKVRLNVDSVSYWIATNNAKDNLLKRDYFARYGVAEGVRRLAEDHPFSPRYTRREKTRCVLTHQHQPQRSSRMKNVVLTLAFILAASSTAPAQMPAAPAPSVALAEQARHRAVSLARHHSDSRQSEVHDTHRRPSHREDHGGCDR